MDNERFYGQTSRALAAKVRAAVAMTSADAAKLPTTELDGDTSVRIRCGGKEETWNSRYLAFHYYYAGAMACDGSSEGNRYWQVCGGLLEGEDIPHDDRETNERKPKCFSLGRLTYRFSRCHSEGGWG